MTDRAPRSRPSAIERTTRRARVRAARRPGRRRASWPACRRGATAGQIKLLVEFFTLLALAQMWNLLAGYAGLVSIGQQAFIGLGAYGLFVAADRSACRRSWRSSSPPPSAALVALVTSVFAFRLHGGYFAIGTWVIAEVFRILVSNTKELGAGHGRDDPVARRRWPPADRQALTYWLALAVGVGSIVVAAFIMRSRLGLALRAVRDSEVAARSLGVDVYRAKLAIYLVAAVGACGGRVPSSTCSCCASSRPPPSAWTGPRR